MRRSRIGDRLSVGLLACTFLMVTVVNTGSVRADDPSAPARFTLDDCISIALENQPAINAQRLALDSATTREEIARSYYRPQIDFHSRYTALDEPRTVTLPAFVTGEIADVFSDAAAYFEIARQAGSSAALAALDDPSSPPFSDAKQQAVDSLPGATEVGVFGEKSLATTLTFVQPLWTGGKIYNRHKQAEMGIQAASHDVRKSEQQTVFEVTQAYLGIQLTATLAALQLDTAERLHVIGSIVDNLLQEGGSTDLTTADLHSIRAIEGLQKTAIRKTQRNAKVAETALLRAMGLEQTVAFVIGDDLSAREERFDFSFLAHAAIRQRPEQNKVRIAARIARLEQEIAKAAYRPDVAFFGTHTSVNDGGTFLNPNDAQEWAVGIALSWNVYAGGRRVAGARQTVIEHARAHENEKFVRELILLQVKDAFLEYREASENIALSREAAQNAERAVSSYRTRFVSGLVSNDEYSKFFRDYVEARLLRLGAWSEYYATVYRQNVALAKLQLVTGTNAPQNYFSEDVAERLPAPALIDE